MPLQNLHPDPGGKRLAAYVQEAARGVEGAFDPIVERFYPDIFKMVYYRTQSRTDAEDIVQEVFLQAFKKIATLKAPERIRGWLFQIAMNKVKDYYRKKRWQKLFGKFPEYVDPQDSESRQFQRPDAEKRLQRGDFWKIFNRLIKKLSKMEKEVFLLKFFDHLTISEIAQILNRSESTVKTCLYRAMGKFRKESAFQRLFQEGWT